MSGRMEKQGAVSVFLGIVPGKDAFDDYLRESSNEDNPSIGTTCPLWNDLGLTWLDHDFQDAHYQGDSPVPVSDYLSNAISYIDSFRDAVLESCARLGIDKINAGIFLFDYNYPYGRPFPSQFFKFVGTFKYEAAIPEWIKNIIT